MLKLEKENNQILCECDYCGLQITFNGINFSKALEFLENKNWKPHNILGCWYIACEHCKKNIIKKE